jgi:hypothetical protein
MFDQILLEEFFEQLSVDEYDIQECRDIIKLLE